MKVTKKWLRFKEIMTYTDYRLIELGVCNVKTEDIIALSLWPPNKLASDDKMEHLKKLVKENGWDDPFPQTINLLLLPSGKYTVCEGGNHRPILACELGIPEIQAYVSVVIPCELISEHNRESIKNLDERRKEVSKLAKKRNNELDSKGIYRRNFETEENQLTQIYQQIDKIEEYIQNILKNEAVKLNILPNRFATPNINFFYK